MLTSLRLFARALHADQIVAVGIVLRSRSRDLPVAGLIRAPSAHGLLHERRDLLLVGCGQLRERPGGGPHGACVEVRRVVEAERRVPALNLSALWKKQMTLPSLSAYAGIPYQVFAARSGALASRSHGCACPWRDPSEASRRSPRARPSHRSRRALPPSALGRTLAAARSSAVHPLDALAVVLLVDLTWPSSHSSFPLPTRGIYRLQQPEDVAIGVGDVATRRPPPTSRAGSCTAAPAAVTSASFASMSETCR